MILIRTKHPDGYFQQFQADGTAYATSIKPVLCHQENDALVFPTTGGPPDHDEWHDLAVTDGPVNWIHFTVDGIPTVLVTDGSVFIMNENGQTIDRLKSVES